MSDMRDMHFNLQIAHLIYLRLTFLVVGPPVVALEYIVTPLPVCISSETCGESGVSLALISNHLCYRGWDEQSSHDA